MLSHYCSMLLTHTCDTQPVLYYITDHWSEDQQYFWILSKSQATVSIETAHKESMHHINLYLLTYGFLFFFNKYFTSTARSIKSLHSFH